MNGRNLRQNGLIWKRVVRLWMEVEVVAGEGKCEGRRGNQSCHLLHLPRPSGANGARGG